MTVCKAKKKGLVKRRLPILDYVDENGKKYYSCWGWIDKMYDEPLDECRECPDYYRNAESRFGRL